MLGPWGSGSVGMPGQGLGEPPGPCLGGSLAVPVPGDGRAVPGAGQGLAGP